MMIFQKCLHVSRYDCTVVALEQLASYDKHVIAIGVAVNGPSLDAYVYVLYALTFFEEKRRKIIHFKIENLREN